MGAFDLVRPIRTHSHDVIELAGSWHEFGCLSHSYKHGAIDCKRYLQVIFYYHFQILMFENIFSKITFYWYFESSIQFWYYSPSLNCSQISILISFLPTQPASSFFLFFSLCLSASVFLSLSLFLSHQVISCYSNTVEYETWPGELSTYQKLHPFQVASKCQ